MRLYHNVLEVSACACLQLTWVMKHSHMGDAYFDWDAADFFHGELNRAGRIGYSDSSGEDRRPKSQLPQEDRLRSSTTSKSKVDCLCIVTLSCSRGYISSPPPGAGLL